MPEPNPPYGALTIDTSIFDRYGVTLEKGLLKQLDQFHGSPIELIISDIVHEELKKHLLDKKREARSKVEAALKLANAQLLATTAQIDQANTLLLENGKDDEIVEARLKEFYRRTDTKLLDSSEFVPLSRLVQMYFNFHPPFQDSAAKKHEFPDAMALLSIEGWAENTDKKVLAISSDKGWKEFAANSVRVDVIEELGEAIALFQPHHAAKEIITALRSAISSVGKSIPILAEIADSIALSIEGADIRAEAYSDFYFEEQDLYAEYVDHEFLTGADNIPEINLIRVEADHIVVQLSTLVTCLVKVSYELSVKDSIDKDYVRLGYVSLEEEVTYTAVILLTFPVEFPDVLEDLSAEEVEVSECYLRVDFGYIKPDWEDYEE